MIAVIKGDIIGSRKIKDPEVWLQPLKTYLKKWGRSPGVWEITGGDGFQLELKEPEQALQAALEIKALLKSTPVAAGSLTGSLDARMAIGMGEKTYAARSISESNGPAFVRSGDRFELLREDKVTLAIRSEFPAFDETINLLLRLALLYMDQWTLSAAAITLLALTHPDATQEELGSRLGIRQNSVSGRWSRAHVPETLALLNYYSKQIEPLTP